MYLYTCRSISATTLLGGGSFIFPSWNLWNVRKARKSKVSQPLLWKKENLKFARTCVEDLTQLWLGGTSCFSDTNPFNFWQPFAVTIIEIYRWKFTCYLFWYALSVPANRIFQKQTVFVFTGSWSFDQLLLLVCGLACEQALLFGQAKRVSRGRVSERPLCPSRLRRWLLRSRETCFHSPK